MAVGAQPPLEVELLEDDELELPLEDEVLELLDDVDELPPPSRKASIATVGRRVLASHAPLV